MNLINIDLDKLIETGVSFEAHFVLYCLNNKNKELLIKYIEKCGYVKESAIDFLEENGYITNANSMDGLTITDKAKDMFFDTVDSWIDTWYELWPKGVQSGGFYVKSSKSGCLDKMKKFIKNNPQYTKGIIIAATKKYISECKERNFDKMKLAAYFIEKDKISMLEGFCERLYTSVRTKDVEEHKTENFDSI